MNCYDGIFMKRTLPLLLIVPLAVLWSCKKAPAPAAAPAPTAAPATAPGGATVSPGTPGAPAAIKPVPPEIPAVLARVNGEVIERWEFDNAVKRVEKFRSSLNEHR